MGDGRVLDAAPFDLRANAPRGPGRPSQRANAGDPAADRPEPAGGHGARTDGECTIWVDCDVLQADGGTRTASITAGYLALAQAVRTLAEAGSIPADVLRDSVAAVSAGIVGDDLLLDLAYEEDARAEVDFNVVMTGAGDLVEVQGTAEGRPFSRSQLDALLASEGISQLVDFQRQTLGGPG